MPLFGEGYVCNSMPVWSKLLGALLMVGYDVCLVAKLSSSPYSFLLQAQQLVSSMYSYIRETLLEVFQETQNSAKQRGENEGGGRDREKKL